MQRATTHDSFLTDNFGDSVEIVRYGTQDEANLDLVAGRVDLLLADSVTLSDGLLKTDKGKDFEFVGPAYSDPKVVRSTAPASPSASPTPICATSSTQAIDAIRANGTWDKIAAKYFDFDVYGS